VEGRRALNASELARERILATVDSIPRGKVATYGQVAREAGLSGRARLVGHCLRGLGPRSRIPWWRVLGAGGVVKVGGAARAEQIRRLRRERVTVAQSGRVDLARCGWRG
jgi:methylated-DNA-protein-cysteine methyltransferase-like protein